MRRPTPGEAIVFTRYALAKLALRNLSREEVEAVVRSPLVINSSRLDPTGSVLTRTVAGRRISVVVIPEGEQWAVLTAWEEF